MHDIRQVAETIFKQEEMFIFIFWFNLKFCDSYRIKNSLSNKFKKPQQNKNVKYI